MKLVKLGYGDRLMPVDLADTAMIVRYGETYTDPPKVDPHQTSRKALENPRGLLPLKKLGVADKKVVIAFPDRVILSAFDYGSQNIPTFP